MIRWISYAIITAAVLALAFALSVPARGWPSSSAASSVVKVLVGPGHGSGVHIGHGLIVTAWHVIHHDHSPSIKLAGMSANSEALAVETVWSSRVYDVALLRMADRSKRPATASLSCSTAPIGTAIEVIGHPTDSDTVHTWGHVASGIMSKESAADGPNDSGWREVVAADVSISPGNSGGPAVDSWGRVVGIAIGYTEGAKHNLIVPSSTICHLLARS